jgi:hypothetical protein
MMIKKPTFPYFWQALLFLMLTVFLLLISAPAKAQSALQITSPTSSGGDFELNWYTVDGGGGTCQGGDFSISGTVGQPDAGQMQDGNFSLNGGFWSAGLVQRAITEMKEIFLPLITR